MLPPHYVQLAAALGLNTQAMIDPISDRNDLERLIELNRSPNISQTRESKIGFDNNKTSSEIE